MEEEIKIGGQVPKRRRTVKEGKTRRKPVPKWKQDQRRMNARVKRLGERVKSLVELKNAPQMAFFYVVNGQLHAKGTEPFCRIIKKAINLEDIESSVPAGHKLPTCNSNTIDLRKMDLTISWDDVANTVVRPAYSKILFNKGKGERSTYAEENKPCYWPADVPFCSMSKNKDGGGRVLSHSDLVLVLKAFQEYCLDRIFEGTEPINVSRNNTVEQLQSLAMRKYGIDKEYEVERDQQEMKEDVEPASGRIDKEYEVERDQQEKKEDVEPASGRFDNDYEHTVGEDEKKEDLEPASGHPKVKKTLLGKALDKGNTEDIIEAAINGDYDPEAIWQLTGKLLPLRRTDLRPNTQRLRKYSGPGRFLPCGQGFPFWEMFSIQPDYFKLQVFANALLHLEHYTHQYLRLGASVDAVRIALQSHTACTAIDQLLEMEAREMLVADEISPAAKMFVAGYLGQELDIYCDSAKPDVYPPCPCMIGAYEVHSIYYESKTYQWYPLSDKEVWTGSGPKLRKTAATDEDKDRNEATLPGVQSDGRALIYEKHEMWANDIRRIKHNEWIDDSVVNIFMSYYRNQCVQKEQIFNFDSFFAQKLLVPPIIQFSHKLPMTACNITAVERWARAIQLSQKEVIFIPICDNIHWTLMVYVKSKCTLFVLCSMGGNYPTRAKSVRRYLTGRFEKEGVAVEI